MLNISHAFIMFFALLITGFISCKDEIIDAEPSISFIEMSKDTLDQGLFVGDEFTFITIFFEDGNGDLDNSNDTANVFFIDIRQDVTHAFFKIPEFPEGGGTGAIQGEITFKVFTLCCINEFGDTCIPSEQNPLDSVQFEIFLVDAAGNESNRILTPKLYLRCE